ncbi:MAG TPA: Calx-beta domain-containing protein [Thermoanaerobaculia bacterium]|nr:Calx-beta domain-containing protein [Thermoanaerobaculia bacterium]
MRFVSGLLAFALILHAPNAFACGDLNRSRFLVNHSCDYSAPCLEGAPVAFRLEADTACYPWYAPCAAYTFTSCDVVEWDFGDGTTAAIQGSGTVTHTFATAGEYVVMGKVTNPSGQKDAGTYFVAVRKPPSFVHWSADVYDANEHDGTVTLTIQREGDTSRPVSLEFGVTFGQQWDGNLERPQGGTTIPAGVTSIPVTLQILNDSVYTGETQHIVSIFCRNGDAVLPFMNTSSHTFVRLIDDDPGPTATISDVRVAEGNPGITSLHIPITLSEPLARDLPIFWYVSDGTATHGYDYRSQSGYVVTETTTIPAGQTTGALDLTILGDPYPESDETFTIRLDVPLGPPVKFTQNPITVTIADDDLYGLETASNLVAAGNTVAMSITSTRPAATPIDVALSSSNPSVLSVPPSITMLAGATEAHFDAVAVGEGNSIVTAAFPTGEHYEAQVVTFVPRTITADQRTMQLGVGMRVKLHLSVSPLPGADTIVLLETTAPNIVKVPARVTLASDGTAVVDVEGLKIGSTAIIATLGSANASTAIPVDVVASPRIKRRI